LTTPDVIDVTQAQKMVNEGTLLLDVREQDEYDAVHVPHSKLIPLEQLRTRTPEIADFKDKPIVVICHSGHRSQLAVLQLKEMGYTHASSISGGVVEWEKSGLKVVKDK